MAPILLNSKSLQDKPLQNVGFQETEMENVAISNYLQYTNDNSPRYESISQNGENGKFKMLEDELNELFNGTRSTSSLDLDALKRRIIDILQKYECEKIETMQKLDNIRRQLIDIESTATDAISQCSESDSGFLSKLDCDQDTRMLNIIKKRMRYLNEHLNDQKRITYKLEIQKNELDGDLKTEKTFSQRNQQALKEIADLLCELSGQQFSYKELYNVECTINPFLIQIHNLVKKFGAYEDDLSYTVDLQRKKIDDLEERNYNYKRTNDNLHAQIDALQKCLIEKEQRIKDLNIYLSRAQETQNQCPAHTIVCPPDNGEILLLRCELSKANHKLESIIQELERSRQQEEMLANENRKLNAQFHELRKEKNDYATQVQRMAMLLKTQEKHRMDLAMKCETVEQTYEEQVKKLNTANTHLKYLQDRFQLLEKRHEEHNMERTLLREEVLSLREKKTTADGQQQAILAQMSKNEKELFRAHEIIKKQQNKLQEMDRLQHELNRTHQESHGEIAKSMQQAYAETKYFKDELEKEIALRKQNEKVIESYRKWKDAQIKADDANNLSFRQYEDHIKSLLEEKQKFLEQYRSLHSDYSALQIEMDRMKIYCGRYRTVWNSYVEPLRV